MLLTSVVVLFAVAGMLVIAILVIKLLQASRLANDLTNSITDQKAATEKTIKEWSDYAAFKEAENKRLSQNIIDQKAAIEKKIKEWSEYAAFKEAENKRLSQYVGIADADERAKALVAEATERLNSANQEAARITTDASQNAASVLGMAQQEATSLTSAARAQANLLKSEAQASLTMAAQKASQLADEAQRKAKEIAGSAYEALQNASLYENAAKAMKNIIEGYGDQYLIPGDSLLDDLADDFSHLQAGQELKSAREHTRLLVKSGSASKCEYVEVNRRDYARNFVLDAFNGRVDSILSRVRHDNAGTLEQEIRDAFTMVNYNGKAFRDARITDEFLLARLNELRWAAIAQQLKIDEREEQRKIKDQIREEEKARRDYERAMREASKEEDMLRKAMEKAQQQIEQASAEQKEAYELKLQELSVRLKEAEEKNQRALSMAQQTKRGHVYIISNIGSFGDNVYKIGLTRRLEPLDRIRELGDSSVPFDFDVHAMIFSDNAPALESQLHKHFLLMQMNKVNHRKEFFKVDMEHIREEITNLGLQAKWTMTSLAREYHESLAIEEAMASDPAKKEAWIRRQLDLELATDYISETKQDDNEVEQGT